MDGTVRSIEKPLKIPQTRAPSREDRAGHGFIFGNVYQHGMYVLTTQIPLKTTSSGCLLVQYLKKFSGKESRSRLEFRIYSQDADRGQHSTRHKTLSTTLLWAHSSRPVTTPTSSECSVREWSPSTHFLIRLPILYPWASCLIRPYCAS